MELFRNSHVPFVRCASDELTNSRTTLTKSIATSCSNLHSKLPIRLPERERLKEFFYVVYLFDSFYCNLHLLVPRSSCKARYTKGIVLDKHLKQYSFLDYLIFFCALKLKRKSATLFSYWWFNYSNQVKNTN